MEQLKIKLRLLLKKALISVSEQQLEQLITYIELLNKWNSAYNLTSIRDKNEMLIKHIMDSLVVSPYLMGQQFIDVGTGPGLPGIPLSILNPSKNFTLLDSLGKKIRFLKQVNYELKLTNVTIVQERVEKYCIDSKFDGIISRAFNSLHNMTSSCRHLLDENGFFYALKGGYPEEELLQLSSDIELIKAIKLEVPELKGDRHLIILGKINHLNNKLVSGLF